MHILRTHLTPEQMKTAEWSVRSIVTRAMDDNLTSLDQWTIRAIIHPTGLVQYTNASDPKDLYSIEALNKELNYLVGPDRVKELLQTIRDRAAKQELTQGDFWAISDSAKVLAGLSVNNKPLGTTFDVLKDELFPFDYRNPIDTSVTEAGNLYGDYDKISEFTNQSLYIAVVDIFD